LTEPQLILPLCLNHAETPGEVREVHPCECCRNFEARREPGRAIEPPPGPEVKYIPLGNHQFAMVDAADFDWLNRYTWRLIGGPQGAVYAGRIEHGRIIYMHREIMQTPPGLVVHHINHNPVNNRRCNLHNCTTTQNGRNQRPRGSKSGFVGVYPCGKKWRAEVYSGGRRVYSEAFDNKIEAAKARDRKAYELFGPFAYLNFPEEIHAGQATRPAGPGTRYVELSGAAHGHCVADATLMVIHVGAVP
jgi:hypothetical protein